MGAEESTLAYPGARQPTNTNRAPTATNRPQAATSTATTRSTNRRPTRTNNEPALVPQAVVLVGYTPFGDPIFMANPSAQSYTHSTNLQAIQTRLLATTTQQAVDPFATTSIYAPTSPLSSISAPAVPVGEDYLATQLQTHQPQLVVPKTVYGPDGLLYTALVRPTSSADVGSQVLRRGITKTGDSFQDIREPNGRVVRHLFHTNKTTSTTSTNARTSTTQRSTTTTTTTSPLPSTFMTTPISTSSPPAHREVNQPSSSASTKSIQTVTPTSTPVSKSPPHPTVLSTAEFLRANSSLDTSYCPTTTTNADRSSLVNYVSWESTVVQLPSSSNHIATVVPPPVVQAPSKPPEVLPKPPANPVVEDKPPAYPALPETVKIDDSHTPSRALKGHLSRGGDRGLIEVYNPYDDL